MSFLFCRAMDTSTTMADFFPECQDSVGRVDFSGIETWDVSNVKTMEGMFWDNGRFNEPIGNWDVSNVTNMNNMFLNAKKFNQDLSKWNVSNVVKFGCIFCGCPVADDEKKLFWKNKNKD